VAPTRINIHEACGEGWCPISGLTRNALLMPVEKDGVAYPD
jgi:hypothetical protein